jgi:hypothetical protein
MCRINFLAMGTGNEVPVVLPRGLVRCEDSISCPWKVDVVFVLLWPHAVLKYNWLVVEGSARFACSKGPGIQEVIRVSDLVSLLSAESIRIPECNLYIHSTFDILSLPVCLCKYLKAFNDRGRSWCESDSARDRGLEDSFTIRDGPARTMSSIAFWR